jgi:hypothetical protein
VYEVDIHAAKNATANGCATEKQSWFILIIDPPPGSPKMVTRVRSNGWLDITREVRVNSLPINIVPHNWPLRYSRPEGVPFGNYPAYGCSSHSDKCRVKPVRYRDSDKGRQQ